jgi:hypothetical protein
MTKKMTPYVCKSTGETIQIYPISQVALTLQAKREFPPPQAPLIEVEIAGKAIVERNSADPDYIDAIRLWENMLQFEITGRLVKRIAMKQHLNDEQKAEVAQLRKELEDEVLPESDNLLWLTEIAIGDDADLQDLLKTVSGLADPTRDGIESAKRNFRHKV